MQHWIARTIAPAALTVALVAAITACGSAGAAPASSAPPVDQATATAIARNALEGYNTGDYETWARDWSDTMRSAIDATAFASARAELMGKAGRFVAIKGVTYAQTRPTVHRYTFTVEFERVTSTVWFGFYEGSPKVEGVQFE